MKTYIVQIGNSDDKLTQKEWADYVEQIDTEIRLGCWEVHFSGASYSASKYQNACWVFEAKEDVEFELQQGIRSIRHSFHQTSVAWTEGKTEFI